MKKTLPLKSIRIDGGTQSRAALNDDAVADYAATIRDGTDFPPVIVFHDGKHHWLADGFHRWHAYRSAGASEIACVVREGTKRDAILFSVGANTDHGLRRSNADKRSAVMVLLDDAEWSKWSDRQIAKAAGVTHPFVASLRPKVVTVTTSAAAAKEQKSAEKAAREAQQAEWDRQREDARKALAEQNPEIAAIEAAKARNGARNAAVAGTPGEDIEAIKAERDELREENTALKADLAERDARLARFDDLEKRGYEAALAARDETIRVLKTRVERESGDKASWKRTADYRLSELKKLGWTGNTVRVPING